MAIALVPSCRSAVSSASSSMPSAATSAPAAWAPESSADMSSSGGGPSTCSAASPSASVLALLSASAASLALASAASFSACLRCRSAFSCAFCSSMCCEYTSAAWNLSSGKASSSPTGSTTRGPVLKPIRLVDERGTDMLVAVPSSPWPLMSSGSWAVMPSAAAAAAAGSSSCCNARASSHGFDPGSAPRRCRRRTSAAAVAAALAPGTPAGTGLVRRVTVSALVPESKTASTAAWSSSEGNTTSTGL
mmetsp:Transcript_14476/g.39590  ORF Transcript_14476/g.39590 Transcript_14476/m.39590 type:complete len:248 (-) Transcript_14476:241-984(-)